MVFAMVSYMVIHMMCHRVVVGAYHLQVHSDRYEVRPISQSPR